MDPVTEARLTETIQQLSSDYCLMIELLTRLNERIDILEAKVSAFFGDTDRYQ